MSTQEGLHARERAWQVGVSCVFALCAASAQGQTTVAGTAAGQFVVSPSGSASYSLPIQVPPGVAGIQPKLELVYGGQGGGLLGVGWTLNGFSAITRCARTVAQDGVRGAVKFDDNDRYCLDGQRLMLVNGAYAQDGAEYRIELDNFTKIVSYSRAGSGASWFKVWTKGGQVLEYGNTMDSKIEVVAAAGTTAPWSAGTVREWAMNKVSDAQGNYLTATYDEDAANGVYRPSRVDYTGNAVAGMAPQSSVRFTYENIPNPIPRFQVGSQTKQTSRLSEIASYSGASTLVAKTKLAYESSGPMQASRLTSATVCDAQNQCLPPLTMTYAVAGGGIASTPTAWPLPSGVPGLTTQHLTATYNDEYIYGSPGYGRMRTYTGIGLVDLNGDGLPDLYLTNGGPGTAYLNTGSGFATAATPWNLPSAVLAQSDSTSGYTIVAMVDLNGDGLPDLYRTVGPFGTGPAVVYLNTGNGFSSVATPWSLPPPMSNSELVTYGATKAALVDLDGDGLLDAYVTDGTNPAVAYLNTGAGFSTVAKPWPLPSGAAPPLTGIPTQRYSYSYYDEQQYGTPGSYTSRTQTHVGLVDLNGDGLPDLYVTPAGPTGVVAGFVYFNTGNGFSSTATPWPLPSGVAAQRDSVSGMTITMLTDLNGDGLVDVYKTLGPMGVGNPRGEAYFNTGNGFSTVAVPWALPTYVSTAEVASGGSTQFSMVDLDGDGHPDGYSTDGTNPAQVYLSNSAAVARLSKVTSTTTPTIDISYSKLSNAAVYTKDSGANAAAYPKVDLAGAQTVVSSVATSNGIGGVNTTTYQYGGLKAELGFGRGVLGFRWSSSKETTTGLETYTEYRQDFPYLGMPSKKETRLAGAGSGGVLKRTTLTPGCQIPQTLAACSVAAGNRYFTYVASTSEQSWDLSGAALPSLTSSYTFGESPQYGNPTQVNVSNGDGSSKSVVNEYWPADTSNWILGRVKKTTVTSTKP